MIRPRIVSSNDVNNDNYELTFSEINVELSWIEGLRDQVEFLNATMKHHCVLFKVQRREFLTGGVP